MKISKEQIIEYQTLGNLKIVNIIYKKKVNKLIIKTYDYTQLPYIIEKMSKGNISHGRNIFGMLPRVDLLANLWVKISSDSSTDFCRNRCSTKAKKTHLGFRVP